MKYPSWKDFESKYPDYQEIAFEALARMLLQVRVGGFFALFQESCG